MASIHKTIPIEAPADHVWDAVRDFGALHTRLVPGFVLDTHLEGQARCRLIWIVDVLPHEIAPYIDGQMDQAAAAMQKALRTTPVSAQM